MKFFGGNSFGGPPGGTLSLAKISSAPKMARLPSRTSELEPANLTRNLVPTRSPSVVTV
jgi:hypothetical protein